MGIVSKDPRTGFAPVILYPHLYDRAAAEGYDMAGFVKSEPIPKIEPVLSCAEMSKQKSAELNPIERMNRHQRRRRLRELGYTWGAGSRSGAPAGCGGIGGG